MQYILSEEEFKNLIEKEKYELLKQGRDFLGNELLKIMDRACIYDKSIKKFMYCDECPLSAMYYYPDYQNPIYRSLCSKPKEYSK